MWVYISFYTREAVTVRSTTAPAFMAPQRGQANITRYSDTDHAFEGDLYGTYHSNVDKCIATLTAAEATRKSRYNF